jgi:hypothetical protein
MRKQGRGKSWSFRLRNRTSRCSSAADNRRSGSSTIEGSSNFALALELSFELDFVTERDTVFADRSDRRLYAARVVDRTGPHDHNSKASALIKSQCVKIIVGGGYPQEAHALGSQPRDKKFDQGRANALADFDRVQGNKFRDNDVDRSSDLIGCEALLLTGNQSRQVSCIDYLSVNNYQASTSPPFIQDRIYPGLIFGLLLSDLHPGVCLG